MQKSSEMAVRQGTGTHLICADLPVPGVLVHVESGHGEMLRGTQVVTWLPWEGPLSHGLGIELTKNHRWRDILGVSIALPVQRWQSWSCSYHQPTANPAFWCQQSLSLPGVLTSLTIPVLLNAIQKSFRTFYQARKPRSKSLANILALFLRKVLMRNQTKIFLKTLLCQIYNYGLKW